MEPESPRSHQKVAAMSGYQHIGGGDSVPTVWAGPRGKDDMQSDEEDIYSFACLSIARVSSIDGEFPVVSSSRT